MTCLLLIQTNIPHTLPEPALSDGRRRRRPLLITRGASPSNYKGKLPLVITRATISCRVIPAIYGLRPHRTGVVWPYAHRCARWLRSCPKLRPRGPSADGCLEEHLDASGERPSVPLGTRQLRVPGVLPWDRISATVRIGPNNPAQPSATVRIGPNNPRAAVGSVFYYRRSNFCASVAARHKVLRPPAGGPFGRVVPLRPLAITKQRSPGGILVTTDPAPGELSGAQVASLLAGNNRTTPARSVGGRTSSRNAKIHVRKLPPAEAINTGTTCDGNDTKWSP